MARPTMANITPDASGWDSAVQGNFEKVYNSPFPMPVHSGDESDLQTTFPAAEYDRCMIWVDHTVNGWELHVSNGTSWAAYSP